MSRTTSQIMNRMMKKNTIVYIAFALFLSSCSLDENPVHFVSRENFFRTESECRAAVNSCYRPLKSIYQNKFLAVTEACNDLFTSSSSGKTDFTLAVSPAQPQFGLQIWQYGYQGVMYCNECIEMIGRSGIDENSKSMMTGEARILRALYYYLLTNVFNGVPFYTCMVESHETLEEIRKLPRTEANTIRYELYRDLEENVLPYYDAHPELKLRGSEVAEQRAGYPLALMLMAKFAMWYEDWDAALAPLEALEELYGELTEARYPLEETMWSRKNTAESIFEIQHAWSETGVQFYSTIAPSMYPKLDKDGGWYDGVYMPEIGTTVTRFNVLTCTAYYAIYFSKKSTSKVEDTGKANALMNPLPLKFTEYNEATGRYDTEIDLEAFRTGIRTDDGKKVDRRSMIALGFGRTDNGETFKAVKIYGKPYCGPKFWCPGMVTNHDDNNYKIFRYADAVLMMAECHNRNGDIAKALKYVNYTRTRAGIDPVSGFLSEDEMMAEIQNERARELGGEMHRKFDLVRWGIWYSRTVTYNYTNPVLSENIRPYHRYYPIPDTECALSGYVLTNDEYNDQY